MVDDRVERGGRAVLFHKGWAECHYNDAIIVLKLI